MQAVLVALAANLRDGTKFRDGCNALRAFFVEDKNSNDVLVSVPAPGGGMQRLTPYKFIMDAPGPERRKAQVMELLWGGCGVPTESVHAESALCMAVSYNLVEIAETLLAVCGARFNPSTDSDGVLTLCDLVVDRSRARMLRLLSVHAERVRHSVAVDRSPYANGQTALHVAVRVGNMEAAVILLRDFGFSENARDGFGRRPVEYVNGMTPNEIVQLLVLMSPVPDTAHAPTGPLFEP